MTDTPTPPATKESNNDAEYYLFELRATLKKNEQLESQLESARSELATLKNGDPVKQLAALRREVSELRDRVDTHEQIVTQTGLDIYCENAGDNIISWLVRLSEGLTKADRDLAELMERRRRR